jgi:hypothetical protein
MRRMLFIRVESRYLRHYLFENCIAVFVALRWKLFTAALTNVNRVEKCALRKLDGLLNDSPDVS